MRIHLPKKKFEKIHFDPSIALLPENVLEQGERMMVAISLYHRSEQLGYMMFEPADISGNMYETLCIQISNTIPSSLIFSEKLRVEERLRSAMKDLEVYNTQLNNNSFTDELTGLYNRRGFLSFAQKSLELARRMKKKGLMVFCDLDGLKKINGTFGHDSGDRAIAAMGKILLKEFRSMDIVSRLGGDEFAIFAIDITDVFLDTLRDRINGCIEIFNEFRSEKFVLSISIGAVVFPASGDVNLETLLCEADHVLYEEKRMKKEKREKTDLPSPCAERG